MARGFLLQATAFWAFAHTVSVLVFWLQTVYIPVCIVYNSMVEKKVGYIIPYILGMKLGGVN